MIKLTKDGTVTPADYSVESGLVPITAVVTLDGLGTSVVAASADPVFVWANNLNALSEAVVGTYTTISLAITAPEAGITWELSLNGTTGWGASISPSTITVSGGFQAVQVYARCTVLNNETVATNNYVSAKVRLQATENPV